MSNSWTVEQEQRIEALIKAKEIIGTGKSTLDLVLVAMFILTGEDHWDDISPISLDDIPMPRGITDISLPER